MPAAGGSRRACGALLDPGAAAPPHVLLPDGAVQRGRGVGGAVERSADAWLEHDPAGSVRPVRPAGAVEAPTAAYKYADWRRCRVGIDYHIEVDRGFYSVPHLLLRQEVEVRLTVGTVEVFRRGKRVARVVSVNVVLSRFTWIMPRAERVVAAGRSWRARSFAVLVA